MRVGMQKQGEPDPQASEGLRRTVEQKSAEIARQAQHSQWLAENKGALDECNRRIESCGIFSDGLRRF